jgi:hypothetical protein
MRNLAIELNENSINIDNIITKIRKIDSHLHYYTKSHGS